MELLFLDNSKKIQKKLTDKEQKLYDTFQTPIDDFVGNSQQEYLERYDYFQDILDIVEDLKKNGEYIEKNYHAIVGIGEMQDYFRNKELQEKINLVLDEIIINLEKLEKSKKLISEEEERQLDHIKRFINKRGLKNTNLKLQFQKIQKLTTKIVNYTKSIENKKGYKKKVEFKDLFDGLSNREIEGFLSKTQYIQLTKGCSGNYSGCCFDALNRKHLGTYLSWNAVKSIIDGLGEQSFHIFYFASDPLDWYDEEMGKDYSDIAEYYKQKFGEYPKITTKVPNKKYSIKVLKNLILNKFLYTIRISVTKKNFERIKDIFLDLKKKYGLDFLKSLEINGKIEFVINSNKKMFIIHGFEGFFDFLDNLDDLCYEGFKIEDLYHKLGKKFDYLHREMPNFNSSDISYKILPDTIGIYCKIKVSAFFPNGYYIKRKNVNYTYFNDFYVLGDGDINLGSLYLIVKYNDNGISNIKKYLKNNPSHKLFFKKKFEKLIDTELFEKVPEIFDLLGLKK